MKCPVCGSDISTGVKYCPVCGTDVEAALQRAEQRTAQPVNVQPRPAAAPQAPEAPQYAAPDAGAARQQPLHTVQAQGRGGSQGRGFDTASMKPAPKWPIVLVVVLVVVIVAALLAILRPWEAADDGASQTGQAGQEQAGVAEGSSSAGADAVQPSVSDAGQAATQQPAAGLDEAAAFAQLTAVYDQFAGFEARVQSIVDYFNTAYPDGSGSDAATVQSWLSASQTLLSDLAAQTAALNQVQLAEGSAYAQTLANLLTLNTDLTVRTQDLADALQAWLAGDSDAVSAALTRHNDGGVSVYKTEYESLYPVARPVQA